MKRLVLCAGFLLGVGLSISKAQISEGGLPLSMSQSYAGHTLSTQAIPQLSFQSPDLREAAIQDSMNDVSHNGLLRIAMLVNADIDFKNAGTITTMPDGLKVWQLKISIPGSRALGLYYDQFSLPEGVKYFITNSTAKQVLGAYTSRNNAAAWATEKVQGDIVMLEMDIPQNTDVNNIRFHVNNIAVFDKATNYLNQYAAASGSNLKTTAVLMPYDSSSPCEVNAACASGFINQKNATVHIEYLYPVAHPRYVYAATGVMVNNTSGDCAPLVLTASHVEPTNQTANATFANWIFYFNYQTPTCSYSGAQPSSSQSITGATFKARASYDSASNKLAADYLIVQLSSRPPASYNAYLSGWDRSDAATPLTGTFISFHHPNGDVKKASTTSIVNPDGNFNGGGTNTHWSLYWLTGGTEEGSSGSGLFNGSGSEIGILSGGVTEHPACTTPNSSGQEISDYAVYSKLAFDWAYNTSGSIPLGSILDPTGSNVKSLSGVSACPPTAVTSVTLQSGDIKVYPNPANDAAYINIDRTGNATISIELYNTVGARLYHLDAEQSSAASYRLDLSSYPAGIYMLRVLINNIPTVRKITISK